MTERELLVEALARLQALSMLPGDPGGPFFVGGRRGDVNDLETAMRWIEPVRTSPPSWDDEEHDPLAQWAEHADAEDEVDARAMVLLNRMRTELTAYHARRGDVGWRGWWRGAEAAPAGPAV